MTIATFELPSEMYVIRSKLEFEGIECFVKDELTVQSHNFYSQAIGGVKLQVRRSDVEKAKPILKEAGLFDDTPREMSPLLKKLDQLTSKIPGFGKLILELRLIILAAIIVFAVLTPFLIFWK